MRVNSITVSREANAENGPFVLGAKGVTLTVDRKLTSDGQAQLVVRGVIAAPWHRDQGAASSDGDYTFMYKANQLTKANAPADTIWGCHNARGTPIVLDDATIEKPCYFYGNVVGAQALYALPGTTNVILGALCALGSAWHIIAVDKDALLDLRGGLTGQNRPVLPMKGTLKITDKPWDRTAGLNLESGTLVLDATNCTFGTCSTQNYGLRMCSSGYGGDGVGTLRFARSGCFRDDNKVQFDICDSKQVTVDFGATTQRISRIWTRNTCADSTLTGVWPAMLEVKGGTVLNASELLQTELENSLQVTGGLGFRYLGNGPAKAGVVPAGAEDTLVLSGKAFESCGNLEVDAGTLELAADASWLNGTNFVARGTGTLKFDGSRQLGSKIAVLKLEDDGKVSVANGKRLAVAECWVEGQKVEDGEYRYATAPAALKAHLANTTGLLCVGKFGALLIVR